MRISLVSLVLAVAVLAAVAPLSRAEIQTLFRGECYTFEEAADKLDEFADMYDSREEWEERAEVIRRGVRRGMKLERLPPPCELAPIRYGAHPGNGYTVENVAFESLPGFWVTGNLYLPEPREADEDDDADDGGESAEKRAGVLCTHGHGPDGRMHPNCQARCQALARMGAVVFAYDMVGYGESTQVPHRHSETLRLQTYNSMRAVDFLLSLGNVDEGRLAVTGESGGGTQSFMLACVDDRIDASVPVVQVSAHFYGGCMCESGMPVHKSDDHETNNVEIAATFAPKPQLIVSDGEDWTQNVPQVEFPYIRRVYELCDAEDAVENAHFGDEGHDYGPSKREAMYRFLAEHLDLDLDRILDDDDEVDEDFVEVREREDLLVFPEGHSRPEHALTDAEAVIQQLDRRE
jgi:hypothetical protein